MTTLKELQQLGGFISDALVKKDIEFTTDEGEKVTATVHVKRLSIGEHERINNAVGDKQMVSATRISEAVTLGPKGSERITYQQAYQLSPELAVAMLTAINEVNGGARKNSKPPTS